MLSKHATTFFLRIAFLACCALASFPAMSQVAEPQISFAQENRPHSYYVAQAQAWWKLIEEDRSDENAWWNYYRACRNAQGTANWSTDFVNEGPNLRLGDEIVEMMEESIPGTFTYHYVKGSTGGASPQAGEDLMKAYAMNPEFPGLLAEVVTYAEATHNTPLRREANERWIEQGDWSPGFLAFARNLLSSVQPNGILLTEHDNDTYPLWMVQDAEGFRTDVRVIPINFLLVPGYSDSVFSQLGVPPYRIDSVRVDAYESNWENIIHHLLNAYAAERPLHIAQTVSKRWYEDVADHFSVYGLTNLWRADVRYLSGANANLLDGFDWTHIDLEFPPSPQEERLLEMDLCYLPAIETALLSTSLSKEERSKLEFIGQTIIRELGDDALWDEYPFIPYPRR